MSAEPTAMTSLEGCDAAKGRNLGASPPLSTTNPRTRRPAASRRRSVGRTRRMPCNRTGVPTRPAAERDPMATSFLSRGTLGKRARSVVVETLVADERNEPAGHGAEHRGAFRRAHDHLEELLRSPADGDDEAAAELQLLVQRLGQTRRRGRDRDDGERRVLG